MQHSFKIFLITGSIVNSLEWPYKVKKNTSKVEKFLLLVDGEEGKEKEGQIDTCWWKMWWFLRVDKRVGWFY